MSTVWSIIVGTLGIVSALGCGTRMIQETKSVTSGGALPTIQERLSERVVTGTLIAKDGTQYVVREIGGGERRVHVDQRTKLDPVTSGEMVRIYITDEGHATTLQRVID
jgi:hypothetical protein